MSRTDMKTSSPSNEHNDEDNDELSILKTFMDIQDTEKNETEHSSSSAVKQIEKQDMPTREFEALVHSGDTDSSDDEYSKYGKSLKKLLKNKGEAVVRDTDIKYECTLSWNKKSIPALSPKPSAISSLKRPADACSDSVFGIRIINPLVSSATLKEKMSSREAIPLARLKRHVSSENTSADWVVAGVVIHKSQMKMSQKGFQYYIWKLTDLKEDIKTFSLFLFRAAAKDLWKTKEGTVIAILNPSILDNRDSSGDEATLSIDNAQRVLILGPSKDMGICRARKKNGDNCTSIVNKSKCEYCVYHLKQEYRKCSSRAELQSGGLVNIRNKVLGKNEVFYAGKSFTAIPAKRNWKQQEKDDQRLRSLSLSKNVNTRTPLRTQQLMSTMLTKQSKPLIQKQSDSERLLKLQKGVQTTTSTVSVNDEYSAVSLVRDPANQKFVTPDIPKLDRGCDEIDLNAPISKAQKEQAKINAKKWIRTHGPIKKKDPNSVKKDKSSFKIENPIKISSAGSQGTSAVVPPPTKPFSSSRFQELMNATSKHSELLQANEEKKQEEYFEKLEKKEQLELKMLETYKIACKAVRCMKCKYTAFSASDMCRSESHPLKVLDAVKRFFKCGHCTNRTVTLDLIPLHPCKNCGNSNWMRAPMIREKKGCLLTESLSIRGDEETFLGSVSTQANVNLLIPE